MSQSFAVQFCRIVPPEKLPDRFLTSGLLKQADSPAIGDQVLLVYVFEIAKPWFPSSRVLPTLIDTVTDQHRRLTPDKTLGDQFELLLRSVNEQLNAISEAGETDWIGNLNGMIMVISGDQLHFSQTGVCPAYLLQNNRIRQITDDAGQEREPHPLKTFSNLASGILHENDQILLANQELYREVSLDALRRVLHTSSPYNASLIVARELKRDKNQSVASVIIKAVSGGENQPSEPTDVVLEEEMQSTWKKFGKRLVPVLVKAKDVSVQVGNVGLQAAAGAGEIVKTKVAPKAGEILQKGVEQAKGIGNQVKDQLSKEKEVVAEQPTEAAEPVAEVPAESTPVVEVIHPKHEREKQRHEVIAAKAEAKVEEVYTPKKSDEPEKPETTEEPVTEPEKTVEPEPETVPEISTPETPPAVSEPFSGEADEAETAIGLMSIEESPSKPSLQQAASGQISKARAWLVPARNKKIAAITGAIVLLMVTFASAAARRHPTPITPTANENKVLLDQIEELQKKIVTARELKQDIEATREIQEAYAKINQLKDPNGSQKQQADQLWEAVTQQADELTKTTRLTPNDSKSTFTAQSSSLISSLPYFYGFSTNQPNLLRTGKGDAKETQESIEIGDTSDVIVSIAKSEESDAAGYVLTRKNKIYRIVQNATQTSVRPIEPEGGQFVSGDVLGAYLGNVYVLDGKDGLLWKYPTTGTAYGKAVSLVDATKYDIKKGVSIAIDGAIYVLKSDGKLLKFANRQQDTGFVLKDMPTLAETMATPLQVITDDSMNSIYVLDAGLSTSERSTARIIEFNKSGQFIGQYAFPREFTNVRTFDINPKERKLWILNGSDVVEFDI